MEHHDQNQKLFDLFNKAMKCVIIATCLAGIIAVTWLCTSGRQKAMQTPETAIPEETEIALAAAAQEAVPAETESSVESHATETSLPEETETQLQEETETQLQEETDDVTITARAVSAIPYGYDTSSANDDMPSDDADQTWEIYGYDNRRDPYRYHNPYEGDNRNDFIWSYDDDHGQSRSGNRIYYFWWF